MELNRIWRSAVRNYEIDYQGIVGNAVYLNYLDQARAIFLDDFKVDICGYAALNKNIVLVNTSIHYKKSLKYGDYFSVHSELFRVSRFKFLFEQKILLEPGLDVILEAKSIIACVDSQGKPCTIDCLNDLPITKKD